MIHILLLRAWTLAAWMDDRMDRTERGDVSEKTVTTAVFVALALAMGAIITAAVIAKANSISFN